MKLLIKIIILCLVLYLCYALVAQGQTVNINRAGAPDTTNARKDDSKENPLPDLDEYEYDRSEMEEEDIFSYDQDFLTRKIFQKTPPPLTNKERIIWSFRMADTNAFL